MTFQTAGTRAAAVELPLASRAAPEQYAFAFALVGAGRIVEDKQEMSFLNDRPLPSDGARAETLANGVGNLPGGRNHDAVVCRALVVLLTCLRPVAVGADGTTASLLKHQTKSNFAVAAGNSQEKSSVSRLSACQIRFSNGKVAWYFAS